MTGPHSLLRPFMQTLEDSLKRTQQKSMASHALLKNSIDHAGLKDSIIEIMDEYRKHLGLHEQYLVRVLNWNRRIDQQIKYVSQLVEPINPLYDYELYFQITLEAHEYALEYITSKHALELKTK